MKDLGEFIDAILAPKDTSLADGQLVLTLQAALSAQDRPVLAIDTQLPDGVAGIALEKKDDRNFAGRPMPSVLTLVKSMQFPVSSEVVPPISCFANLIATMSLRVSDASPDSVTSAVLFAARQAGIELPELFWSSWLPVIEAWEQTGNANSPETNWPALASALAHRHFGAPGRTAMQPVDQLAPAWASVLAFFAEAIRAGYDPDRVPTENPGKMLAEARAALLEEKSRYRRRASASDIHQLSLPIARAPRRRLVDALFTREAEFAGALKTIARNDRTGSELGEGFAFLLVERADLLHTAPEYWMTISVDPRAGVHLRDLWIELEWLETEAWASQGLTRPTVKETSRRIPAVDKLGRRFHEPWYLDASETIIGSPKRQTLTLNDDEAPGSLLSGDDVRRAVFNVFNPVAEPLIHTRAPSDARPRLTANATEPLLQTPLQQINDLDGKNSGKRLYSAWWSEDQPLPSPTAGLPLPTTALRGIGALLLGAEPADALIRAPDLTDVEIVTFSNGFAVLNDGGVFLIDSGRNGRSRISEAVQVVRRQAQLASGLDTIQTQVTQQAKTLVAEIEQRGRPGEVIRRQTACTATIAKLIEFRGTLDVPLGSDEAGLQPLKDAIARRWNTRGRLDELIAEVEAFDKTSRNAEELKVFRAGKFIATIALGLVAADALVNPVSEALPWDRQLAGLEKVVVFGVIFGVTVLAAKGFEVWFRQNISRAGPGPSG